MENLVENRTGGGLMWIRQWTFGSCSTRHVFVISWFKKPTQCLRVTLMGSCGRFLWQCTESSVCFACVRAWEPNLFMPKDRNRWCGLALGPHGKITGSSKLNCLNHHVTIIVYIIYKCDNGPHDTTWRDATWRPACWCVTKFSQTLKCQWCR